MVKRVQVLRILHLRTRVCLLRVHSLVPLWTLVHGERVQILRILHIRTRVCLLRVDSLVPFWTFVHGA